MIALGLTVALFLFWGLVGGALVATLHTRRNVLQSLLLAPVVGLAVTSLAVFWLSRAGLPVGRFGALLAAALMLAAVVVLARARPVRRGALGTVARAYLPFGAILALTLPAVARPMLELGFDWVSYANDDMANYVLGAQRFLEHGFFEAPELESLVHGRDYTQYYWFFHVVAGARAGNELVLAWVAAVAGLTPQQAFMPTIVAMHLGLIGAAGALVCQSRRLRPAALLTCGLLAVSALNTLGAIYQLIAQVGGIGLLAAGATLLLRRFPAVRAGTAARHGALAGVVVAALCIMYPEVTPFLGLGLALYSAAQLARRRLPTRPLPIVYGVAGTVGLLLLNTYVVAVVEFLIKQSGQGTSQVEIIAPLFPDYLVPSGLANLWGLQVLSGDYSSWWSSASIVLGGCLLLAATVAAIALTWQGQPAAAIAMAMLALGAKLFADRADFGLFKLAMFVQPFMLGTVVVGWLGLVGGLSRARRPATTRAVADPARLGLTIGPLVALGLLGLTAQVPYVEQSRGIGRFVEIPNASRINAEFQRSLPADPAMPIVLDTSNIVLAKFQALHARGIDAAFPSRFYFINFLPGCSDTSVDRELPDGSAGWGVALGQEICQRLPRLAFNLHDERDPTATNPFVLNSVGQDSPTEYECGYLVSGSERQSLFNRYRPVDGGRVFLARPCGETRDHLIFIHSRLGQQRQTPAAENPRIGSHQLEGDPLLPDTSMVGVGRHLLFQAVGPSPSVRLVLNVTGSLKGDGDNRLPPAAAIGTDRRPFPIVGRGSARVFSPPISPQMIADRAFVAIDMGVDGQRFPDRRGGLMRLYGTDIVLDRRLMVGFARDISLVSEEDYARLAPPSAVAAFPPDLTHPDLEYSGVYEDGWLSEAAFFGLGQTAETPTIAVRGEVPAVGDGPFTPELRVLVDGEEVARRVLGPGEFEVRAPSAATASRRRVELRFSEARPLPGADRRPVTARVRFVGFESGAATAATQMDAGPAGVTEIVPVGSGLALGTGWYPLETFKGETFRWVDHDAEILVEQRPSGGQAVAFEVEPGPGVGLGPFTLRAFGPDGSELGTVEVRGRQWVEIRLPRGDAPSAIRLRADGGGLPAPNDPRTLNFRVFSIGRERP